MFFDRLMELCTENGTTVTALLKSLNISPSKSTAWKYGSMPKANIITALANHFNVSTDFILGNSDIKKTATDEGDSLDSKRKRELELLKEIDSDLLPEVVKFAQYLQSQRDE